MRMAAEATSKSSVKSVQDIFEETYDTFLERLGQFDRDDVAILKGSSIRSAKDLVQVIYTLSSEHHLQTSRLTACIAKVERFGRALSPFFEVISIFVQTDPKYAGLVWGSVRLIFQLGSHYITFLERICQSLERIAKLLPAYEKSIAALKYAVDADGNKIDGRLLMSLSSVYKDVVDFCYEACTILSNKAGLRHRSRLIWRISWQPFDALFACTLDRLQSHSETFSTELSLVQVQLGVAQLDLGKKQRDRLDHLYKQMEDHLKMVKQGRQRLEEDSQEDRLKGEQVQAIKTWINAPQWEELHHAALMRTMPNSTNWFFSDVTYTAWLASVNHAWESDEPIDRGILVVQAKPGYGKTHLCSNIVNQLSSHTSRSANDAWIFYYFFNKAKPSEADIAAAFRAILTQLLHTYRDDFDLIDAASLMMYHGLSGQVNASKEEVLVLLKWCFQRYPQGLLVIDALDESTNPPDFWTCMRIILENIDDEYAKTPKTSTGLRAGPTAPITTGRIGLIVFARPDLLLPNSIREKSHILQPYHRPLTVIESYIKVILEQLVSDDLLGAELDIESLSRKGALHSGDMFLWVRLLEEYLTSDGLSTQERIEALHQMVYLEGLDNLYNAILDRMQNTFPKQTMSKVNRAFQWVYAAERPLSVSELREAICLPAVGPLKDAYVPDFRKAIQRMSGALLEIAADDTVRFIHTSVGDFLRQSRRNRGSNEISDLSPILELERTKQYIATCALSYITQCVPCEPLSGSSQVTPDYHVQRIRFPLLGYILSFWGAHVSSAWKDCTRSTPLERQRNMKSFVRTDCYQMLKQVRSFITNAKVVTMWIEASWLFRIDPYTILDRLIKTLDRPEFQEEFFRTIPATEQADMDQLFGDFEELASDLDRLRTDWNHVLRTAPNEIWEPSIQSQCHSRFWLGTLAAHAERVESSGDSTSSAVLLESKVSSDASEIGMLSLILPETPKDEGMPSSQMPVTSADPLQLCFEVRELTRSRLKYKFTMSITLIDKYWYDLRLELPFAIADDLRKIVVVHTLAIVREIDMSYQSEDAYGCRIDTIFFDSMSLGQPIYTPVDICRDGHLLGALFSQHNKFLLFHHSHSGLSVYRFSTSTGLPQHVSTVYWGTLRIREPNLESIACFHPFLSLILLTTASKTILWNFASKEKHAVLAYEEPLVDIKFSMCGHHVLGSCDGVIKFVDITSLVERMNALSTVEEEYPGWAGSTDNRSTERERSSALLQYANHAPSPSVQSSNVITFDSGTGPGQASISLLQQFREEGTLVITRLCEDGSVITEEISRLPRSINLTAAVLVQGPGLEEGSIRIVLNVKKRRGYRIDFADLDHLERPIILERKKRSIPSHRTQFKGIITGPKDVAKLLLGSRRPHDDESNESDNERAVAKRARF